MTAMVVARGPIFWGVKVTEKGEPVAHAAIRSFGYGEVTEKSWVSLLRMPINSIAELYELVNSSSALLVAH
ncbi:MAG: hypothetical protein ACREHD_27140 [Pirellulales bacterium]